MTGCGLFREDRKICPQEKVVSDLHFAPVILAGGSGTRFWPRSRKARAKQVLALDGERTMIQQTLERLLLVADASDVWVITNDLLEEQIAKQLPEVRRERILSEPAARNTAPACALAAFLLERTEPDTVIGIFPSDHVVKDCGAFCGGAAGGDCAGGGGENIVVLGVSPTRPETGYGYIEMGANSGRRLGGGFRARRVRRFTEKPVKELAEQFLATGNYAWNSGIFCGRRGRWRGRSESIRRRWLRCWRRLRRRMGRRILSGCLRRFIRSARTSAWTTRFLSRGRRRARMGAKIFCLPADFGWNDLGIVVGAA